MINYRISIEIGGRVCELKVASYSRLKKIPFIYKFRILGQKPLSNFGPSKAPTDLQLCFSQIICIRLYNNSNVSLQKLCFDFFFVIISFSGS